MNKTKAVTLIELIIAISLVVILVATISAVTSTLLAMKRDILDKQLASIQGNMGLAAIFERALRATPTNPTEPTFTIVSPSQIELPKTDAGIPVTEKIWLDSAADTIVYNNGIKDKVLLSGVKSLLFVKDYEKRLAVEVVLFSGEKFAIAVQPRNQFTAMSLIN